MDEKQKQILKTDDEGMKFNGGPAAGRRKILTVGMVLMLFPVSFCCDR
jgi:hypothetical protein